MCIYVHKCAHIHTTKNQTQKWKYDTLLSTSKNSAISSSISSSVKGSCTIKIIPNQITMKCKIKINMYNKSFKLENKNLDKLLFPLRPQSSNCNDVITQFFNLILLSTSI